MNGQNESDWKLFRSLIDELRDNYLSNKNLEIMALLSRAGKTPTENFWAAQKRIEQESKKLQQCFDGLSRSRMHEAIGLMLHHGIMTREHFETFSPGFQSTLEHILGNK